MKSINRYIDHTLLKPTSTENDIKQLCKEAIDYNFYSVCVNSSFVKLAKDCLNSTNSVAVCSVIGFPLGAMSTSAKAYEAKEAINNGATEIDMVINIGLLKSEQHDAVRDDIKAVKNAIGKNILKVILEISELTNDEIIKACELSLEANADFVKTSTGFSSSGATLEAAKLMLDTVNGNAKVKASGGIRNFETAKKYIELGVDRLGVSAGIAIVEGRESTSDY